jgi:hypothetical protein
MTRGISGRYNDLLLSRSRRTGSRPAEGWAIVFFLSLALSGLSGCSTLRPHPEERYNEQLQQQGNWQVTILSDASPGEKIVQVLSSLSQVFAYVFASTGGNTDHK